jgi:hypothetical protein
MLQRIWRRIAAEIRIATEQIRFWWEDVSGAYPNNPYHRFNGRRRSLPDTQDSDLRGNFFFDESLRGQFPSALSNLCPENLRIIITEADQICAHVFDLLGSGPVSLGAKIDWHTDFKSGHRWNPKSYYRRIRPAPYPGGYDIKVPWELSRCQHFVRLGQAYWITGDEKYASEFVTEVEDWLSSNPYRLGVNWASTMEVSIRVVNWVWGYNYFKTSVKLTSEFRLKFHKSLLLHGRHIYRNLENQGTFTGNHYLSNLVGLVYLGILYPEYEDAGTWKGFGLAELELEMFKQVYPDGVNFEASTAYHRLVTELFLSATILAKLNGHLFGASYMERLEKMLDFIMYLTKPDGTSPQIGDNDNGRLHRLGLYSPPEREWRDYRYLLAVGAVLFDRKDFACFAGDEWADAFWLFGDKALKFKIHLDLLPHSIFTLASRNFCNAGIFVMRDKDIHLVVDTGLVGQNGNGGHAHRDTLSIELFYGDQTWLTDPGTYVYTKDYVARDLFRSTSYHNTFQISIPKVHPPPTSQQFQQVEQQDCTIAHWLTSTIDDELKAFCSLNLNTENLKVYRRIHFDKTKHYIMIYDRLVASTNVEWGWHWHFPAAVQVSIEPQKGVLAKAQSGSTLWLVPYCFSDVELHLGEYQFSPSYGVSQMATRLIAQYHGQSPANGIIWILTDTWSSDLMDIVRDAHVNSNDESNV